MVNSEKVKMGLRHCGDGLSCEMCVYSGETCTMLKDALALILRQEGQIARDEKTLSEINGYVRELQEAVRT